MESRDETDKHWLAQGWGAGYVVLLVNDSEVTISSVIRYLKNLYIYTPSPLQATLPRSPLFVG